MSDSFNRVGANSFQIFPAREEIKSNQPGRSFKIPEPIIYNQAMKFKENFNSFRTVVSISTNCTRSATVKFGEEQTNPTVRMEGIDENYFNVSAYKLLEGRNFTLGEVRDGNSKVIIGSDIVKQLFDGKSDKAVGKIISINAIKYKIVGVLEEKGSSMGGSSDRRVYIPLQKAKQLFGHAKKGYNITAAVKQTSRMDEAVSNAIGLFRNIRKLKAGKENDFDIRKSDGILERLREVTTELRAGTIAIALLTLLGASIGLMNIMLVSVTERTREIGVRKALGATSKNVLFQFLTEAVVICQIGGILGILLGILVGNLVSFFFGSPFIIPWPWILLGLIVCIIVGIISGLYPAMKASRLDPIESLRHE